MTIEERFVSMLREDIQCLTGKNNFQERIKRCFSDNPRFVNVMVHLYNQGICSDIRYSKVLDTPLLQKHFIRLTAEQGTDKRYAKEAIRIWFWGYGEEILRKAITAAFDNSSTPSSVSEKNDKHKDKTVKQDKRNGYSFRSYVEALEKEEVFLRNGAGQRYVVTNGEFCDTQNAYNVYMFEMESELYLSDDAPLTVYVGDEQANGFVLSCEGFHILIRIDADFGPVIKKGYIAVAPWKLLRTLREKVFDYENLGEIAKSIIYDGPLHTMDGGKNSVVKGQDMAIKRALSQEVTVIWGPPGTGKTYTMSEIAIRAMQSNMTVLMVSHSNISVDGAVESLVKRMKETKYLDEYRNGKTLRFGYVRSLNLKDEENAVSYNYALKLNPYLASRIKELCEIRKSIKKDSSLGRQKIAKIDEELKELRKQIKNVEERLVQNAKYVATTISRATVNSIFDGKKYDVVLFDEASMAYVPQIVYAASLAKKHFICVGDFYQLPPIAQSPAQDILTSDIFRYLNITNEYGLFTNHEWLVVLDTQRRMHSEIARFSNENVYDGILKNIEQTDKDRESIIKHQPLNDKAVCLIDLSGTYCAASKDANNSRFNILTAIFDFASAVTAKEDGETQIGIISPYKAQARLVQAMLQDEYGIDKNTVDCSTVHQFQGYEKNLIIFDPVESYPTPKAGYLLSKNLYQVKRLINVAVTRARGKLLVVSYANFWKNNYNGTKNLCYLLIDYLAETMAKGSRKRLHLMQKYVDGLNFGKNIKYFKDVSEGESVLNDDINQAKDSIIVSLPDAAMMQMETAKDIFLLIEKRLAEGVGIKIWITQKTRIPDKWLKYTEEKPTAVFPVILIDEKIYWHGLPAYPAGFEIKNNTMTVNLQMVFRMKGKYTVGLLGTMTGMINSDAYSIDMETGELSDKHGFSQYIYDNNKCEKCGRSMILTKGNKYYCRCESCGEKQFVPIDMLKEYIKATNPICPIHKCKVKAGVGQQGVYTRCEHGHYVELNRI